MPNFCKFLQGIRIGGLLVLGGRRCFESEGVCARLHDRTAERAAENAHRHRTLMSVAVGLRNQKVRTEVFLLRVRSLVIVPISPPGRNLHPHIRHWKMKRPQLVLKPGKRSIGNYNELEKYLSTNIDLGVKC